MIVVHKNYGLGWYPRLVDDSESEKLEGTDLAPGQLVVVSDIQKLGLVIAVSDDIKNGTIAMIFWSIE